MRTQNICGTNLISGYSTIRLEFLVNTGTKYMDKRILNLMKIIKMIKNTLCHTTPGIPSDSFKIFISSITDSTFLTCKIITSNLCLTLVIQNCISL